MQDYSAKTLNGDPISASVVRACIRDGDFHALRNMVPDATYDYFTSPEAASVIERIQSAQDVIHY